MKSDEYKNRFSYGFCLTMFVHCYWRWPPTSNRVKKSEFVVTVTGFCGELPHANIDQNRLSFDNFPSRYCAVLNTVKNILNTFERLQKNTICTRLWCTIFTAVHTISSRNNEWEVKFVRFLRIILKRYWNKLKETDWSSLHYYTALIGRIENATSGFNTSSLTIVLLLSWQV